jgi:hypothetical protein
LQISGEDSRAFLNEQIDDRTTDALGSSRNYGGSSG